MSQLYADWEKMPAGWTCRMWDGPCLVAAQAGYLSHLCRAHGECLETSEDVRARSLLRFKVREQDAAQRQQCRPADDQDDAG
jgi:hypothetical protein